MHPRTLRIYEDEGLLCPARTPTNIRLYTENDIRRVMWIRHLTQNLGVNLAGVRILFELEERLGTRILEALYAEGTAASEASEADSHRDRQPTPIQPPSPHRPRHRLGEPLMAKRPSNPDERTADHHRITRAAARRASGDGHLPRDDRAAPGRPREERRRAQRRRRRGRPIALVTQRQADQEDIDDPSELYAVGTLAKIAQVVQLQDGTVRAIVQGQARMRVNGFTRRPSRTSAPTSRSSPRSRPTGSRSRR